MSSYLTGSLYKADQTPPLLAVAWAGYQAKRPTDIVGKDKFPVFPDDPLREYHELINHFLVETGTSSEWRIFPDRLETGKPLLAGDAARHGQVILAATARIIWCFQTPVQDAPTGFWKYASNCLSALHSLLAVLFQSGFALDIASTRQLLQMAAGPMIGDVSQHLPLVGVVLAAEQGFIPETLTEDDRQNLTRVLGIILPRVTLKQATSSTVNLWVSLGANPAVAQIEDYNDAFKRLRGLLSPDVVLLEVADECVRSTSQESFYLGGGSILVLLLDSVDDLMATQPLPPKVRSRMETIQKHMEASRLRKDDTKSLTRLRKILNPAGDQNIEPGEAWSEAAIAELKKMSADLAARWWALFKHCEKAESAKPSNKWLKTANALVEELGRAEFKRRVLDWFPLVAKPRPVHREPKHANSEPDPDLLITVRNATILRGLAWCCAGVKDVELSRALSELAEVCFKKVRWLGPRCPRVGNSCLYSLSQTVSEESAAELSKLDQVVKQPTAKKRIGKSLDVAAENTGQTRADLEEKSVPTYDLDATGKLVRTFGQHIATVQIVASREVAVTWTDENGKALKAVPAAVKKEHAADLKQFSKLAKDIEKMLTAQRIRIERLLMTEREWDFTAWRQRYFDQPLLAGLARRLIWHFKLGDRTALGAWLDGKLVDVHGQPLTWLAPETRVRLWHPIGFAVDTVAAWRAWLSTHQICQPFKQAHREVYVLTDAEIATATYSNRFAAHILGQHQFAALCVQRGWKYAFMGGFDSATTPTLELPAWNMAAEFWVEAVGELTDSGVSQYLSTDQVRFLREDRSVPLTDVPAAVFTEVMRDVDLFVGVGSIGADPAWRDQGLIEGGGNYWENYSFGDLSATAQTRRDVLESLLPKLKIASRCSLRDRFLVVRGDLRTYNIHLGSGNIQMEPNNQYLCIVPDRSTAAREDDKVFLPFEGDRMFSVILSKAFLLADDTKIKDPTIISQIAIKK